MGKTKILISLAIILVSLSGCYTKVGYVSDLEGNLAEEDIEVRDTYGDYEYYYDYPYFGFFNDYQWYPYSYYGYFYDPWEYPYWYSPWWHSWDDYYYTPEKKPETKHRDASEPGRIPGERNRSSDKEKDVKRSDRQQTEKDDDNELLRKHRGSE